MAHYHNPDHNEKRRSWRRQFYRDVKVKKARHEKRESKIYIPEEIRMTKLGASEQFNDSILDVSYDWDSQIYRNRYVEQDTKPRRVLSLKENCAIRIAENNTYLSVPLLRTGNWGMWCLVWHYISLFNADSFQLFNMFATVFHRETTFSCHEMISSYPKFKQRLIMCSLLPSSQNHRVERLFSNIKLSQLFNTLNSNAYQNILILEISSSKISQSDLLQLTHLRNLTSLRINNVTPTDSTVHTWCTSIKSQKWQNLQVLSISNLSAISLTKLQSVAKYCKLLFIESLSSEHSSSISLKDTIAKTIDPSRWEIINDPVLNSLNWGMKTLAILRKFKIDNHTLLPSLKTIILDFTIVDQMLLNEDDWDAFDDLWSTRSEKGQYSIGLVLREKLKLGADVSRELRVDTPAQRKKIVKKIKSVSMKSFFDLK